MFNIEDYNYDLREDLIAQTPVLNRDGSRLLVVDRLKEELSDHYFYSLPELLSPGDVLVANNTRVVPARLFGRKESGGQIEILVLEHFDQEWSDPNTRWCLVKASKGPKIGSFLLFENNVTGSVEAIDDDGLTKITFQGSSSIDRFLDKNGVMPLPPYVKRESHDDRALMDRERYQTVFSSQRGAVAAPTAGLHFTDNLIQRLKQVGITFEALTLHVGHGTFRPVRTADIRKHDLGEEIFHIESRTADAVNLAKQQGRRVIAIGTTVVRTLESVVDKDGMISPGKGKTNLLITPGFQFNAIDGLITNLHLPRSSLLFLVSAFGGMDLIKTAYSWAVKKKYRFYSYGDAMLVL